ncbi:MAG: hypothetical protein EOO42_01055 [Flavobacteriales bacterium]|nr:MAG: hypothetical protein EOO42_01055 [Flavobacteriales bacterium]
MYVDIKTLFKAIESLPNPAHVPDLQWKVAILEPPSVKIKSCFPDSEVEIKDLNFRSVIKQGRYTWELEI